MMGYVENMSLYSELESHQSKANKMYGFQVPVLNEVTIITLKTGLTSRYFMTDY